jgi:hypothetical protein
MGRPFGLNAGIDIVYPLSKVSTHAIFRFQIQGENEGLNVIGKADAPQFGKGGM